MENTYFKTLLYSQSSFSSMIIEKLNTDKEIEITSASTIQKIADLINEDDYSLVVLDLSDMPKINDLVRRILKHKKDAYALVLMNIEQKSLFEDLYENGADEIVPSNVDIDLFKLRLNKIIDRSKKYGKLLTKKNIYIDKEKYLVYLDDRELTLPKKEFELLSLLVSKPHKVFSREEIYKLVWGTRIVVGDRTIDVHIRKIREEIGEGKIQTIKGVGYKYIG